MNEIVQGLKTVGWAVDVFAPTYSARRVQPSLLNRLFEQFRVQLALLRRLSDFGVVYVRSHPIAWFTSLVACLRRTPVVQEVNGTFDDIYLAYPVTRRLRRLIDIVMRQQYRMSAEMIAVTPGIARWLEEELGTDGSAVSVIPNGANTDLFHPDLVLEGLQLNGPYVVFVGSRAPWHDIDVILDAISLPDWPSEVKLVLAGDCAEADRAIRAAEQDSRIVLIGRLAHERIGCVLAGALAGLVAIGDPDGRSSKTGVAPIKLFEAMACGVPVIASALPYQAELVTNSGAGLLFPSGDPLALAKAVDRLQRKPELVAQMGQSGRSAVLKEHNWKTRSEETDDVLRRVVARSTQRVS